MTYSGQLENNTVIRVIVGNAEWAATNLGGQWAQSPTKIGIGWTYHGDHFRPPRPFPSWVQDDGWQPPFPRPDGEGIYVWDETQQMWMEFSELPESDAL